MMASDRARAVVKTTVSPAMKAEWKAHAAELDMTQSEFVEAMVQAGRRKLTPDPMKAQQSAAGDVTPGVSVCETLLLERLEATEFVSRDDLNQRVAEHFHAWLKTAIKRLQFQGRVRFSGVRDGYASGVEQ